MTDSQVTASSNKKVDESSDSILAGEVSAEIIEIPAEITVGDLSRLMNVEAIEIIKQLMRTGHMLSINDAVRFEIAATAAQALGFKVRAPRKNEATAASLVPSYDRENTEGLQHRDPVVTILGHVDHGKTTLLDHIRSSNVTLGEAGGITQHIGAYQVNTREKPITFLDTPGHEAFTAMRARGSRVTDIAIVVVAADDGVMPQTIEAIDHVKAADVPIIIAINKIDRPQSDLEKVKRQLAENDVLIEEWGGDVIAVPVSALSGKGVDELLENVDLVAEIAELKANPDIPARSVVIEAQIDKSKGPIATLLVQEGTLRVGDIIVSGDVYGRIRAMRNDSGTSIDKAGPSIPVEVMGIGGLPQAGDIAEVASNEKDARRLVDQFKKLNETRKRSGITLAEVNSMVESGEARVLNLIVKTDVQGSIEAVRRVLDALTSESTKVDIIHASSGSITEKDVLLAVASDAIIIGFNCQADIGAQSVANHENVEIRTYEIIYNLVDDVQKALNGLLDPETRDIVEGVATVRATFSVSGKNLAAGFYVNRGKISRGSTINVTRNGERVYEGQIISLKHFKDDVREVGNGQEGGIVLDGYSSFEEGDVLESHHIEIIN